MSQQVNTVNKNILVDTGFWFSFYTLDDKHDEAVKIAEEIWNTKILVPWPTLYEVLRTKFVRNKQLTTRFKSDLKTLSVEYIDDKPYKDEAMRQTLQSSGFGGRHLSLVDSVIRNILADRNKKIDRFVTFNEPDFIDVCRRRRIPIFYAEQGM